MKSLYENDYYSWTYQQLELIKQGKFDDLDIENLLEEIEDMGKSRYRALESSLGQLILHLLKWQMQSSKKDDLHDKERWYRSWVVSINKQRRKAKKELAENPGLKPKVNEIMVKAYWWAREEAADDLNCKMSDFPTQCPWSYNKIMTKDWLP
ncbi:DUF29 domain-containing protein [Endozoicomonas sp. ONNA1]|uniref:DUF29 domain-containing protein n=1 Tax=Endozoicomonas sp. ONNA1 TaxID=2828740 RepID=UPI0021498832|nr:DUF29 domain-containing protein [Endozoicomonas sp. ONNA1]